MEQEQSLAPGADQDPQRVVRVHGKRQEQQNAQECLERAANMTGFQGGRSSRLCAIAQASTRRGLGVAASQAKRLRTEPGSISRGCTVF